MPMPIQALKDFLSAHAEVKSIATGAGGGKERCYVFNTEYCVLFLAEIHIQQMRDAAGQSDDVLASAKKTGDYTGIIMAYNWNAPDPGMDTIRIPVRLIESLDRRQASIILRNLEGIQQDINEGKQLASSVQQLFGESAAVSVQNNLDGERLFVITSNTTAAQQKGYAERFAEQVVTNVLFDLPKALNALLQPMFPKDLKGRYFIEGRDITSRKLRYGAEVKIEILLTDEGAHVFSRCMVEEPKLGKEMGKILQQGMQDPFGLSMKHYMGKHAIVKLAGGKREE